MPGDPTEFAIRSFEEGDRAAVITLWEICDLVRPLNNPDHDIDRKVSHSVDLLFVGCRGESIVATVMAGYDGHRGWINYLGVSPSERGTGVGAAMMLHAQSALRAVGCPKINLQVPSSNPDAIEFYRTMGYAVDDVILMSVRLVDDTQELARPALP
ncbi:MAG TPA: GNAT family acetyltransferase [Ilumatobacter sp.]|nr:GNAT family acetyltransferase [Ilumatobacter sp.]